MSERRATPTTDAAGLRESPLPHGSARRPLAWAGTALGLVAIGMGLSAVLFAYAYLGIRDGGWPPDGVAPPPLAVPGLATLVLAASVVPAVALQRIARSGHAAGLQAGALGLVALGAAFLALQGWSYVDHGLADVAHVYASTFLLLAALHHLMMLGGIGAAIVLVLRLWSLATARLAGLATALALYWFATAGSWLLIAAVLYLSPYVWEAA